MDSLEDKVTPPAKSEVNSNRMSDGPGGDVPDAWGSVFSGRRTFQPAAGTLPTAPSSATYNMKHRRRGKCVIFNNKTFDHYTRLNERRGTDRDKDRLYYQFRQLDFEVEVHSDYSRSDIPGTLKKVAAMDHTDEDCFVCCILTHGDMGVLYGRDGKFPMDEIFSPFLGNVCPTLGGKPKLFFIQACQGDRLDDGVTLYRDRSDSVDAGGSAGLFKIPVYADFLIAYSTVPGFYSWRNTTEGSWFIQALCDVLEKDAKTEDLLSMMTMVNQKVAYDYVSCVPSDSAMDSKKQVPCITSMLTRKLFFVPKI